MAVRLFIGNLPYKTTSEDLNSLFAQAGVVNSADVVMDKFSGRSRGFGFVEMANDDEAQAAIERFNDFDLEGRKLVVNVARPREDRGGSAPSSTVYSQPTNDVPEETEVEAEPEVSEMEAEEVPPEGEVAEEEKVKEEK